MEREPWLRFYAERGLATVPLKAREKRPLRAGWQVPSASAWENAPEDANVGILCGAASGGLLVLDFDTRDGLREAMGLRPQELAVHTLIVQTARGHHAYARSATVRTCSPWDGLDVRGEGSLVVAPPSVHPSGAVYAFIEPTAPIALLSSLPIEVEPTAAETNEPISIDWERVESWIGVQAPKLRASFHLLEEPHGEFDRSRADFAVSRCLWEGGFAVDEIVAVLLALPGSKAKERGESYARRTVARAGRPRLI